MFIGFLGPEGIETYNLRPIRLALAQVVYTSIGLVMLVWGVIELGAAGGLVQRLAPVTRAFFAAPATKTAATGVLVGLFAIGRPFPVFREFLTYAAMAHNPLYGAAVMVVHGLGMIAVAVVAFLVLVYGPGRRLTRWLAEVPQRAALLTAAAMLTGGAYFVYYWGLAVSLGIGRWGFSLGWYR